MNISNDTTTISVESSTLTSSSYTIDQYNDPFVVNGSTNSIENIFNEYEPKHDRDMTSVSTMHFRLPATYPFRPAGPVTSSILGPSVLFTTFAGPWSRILTSVIFLCALFVLALLFISLLCILVIVIRRLCQCRYSSPPLPNVDVTSNKTEQTYMNCTMTGPPSWPLPTIPNNYHIQTPTMGFIVSTLPRSSSQFYPSKCKELATYMQPIRKAPDSVYSDHIYMDIGPPNNSMPMNRIRTTTSLSSGRSSTCYITSIEDDATLADEVEKECDLTQYTQQMTPNRNYAGMMAASLPWLHQASSSNSVRIHRPSLNHSIHNLRNAKALLKAPKPQIESNIVSANTVQCYNSYSEVIDELKDKLKNNNADRTNEAGQS